MAVSDFRKMSVAFSALVLVSLLISVECRPYYRWFDYDQFAKPIQDTGSGQVLPIVGPLRPYEPWVLDCNLLFHEKTETGKRHPRCKEVDEENEKEYSKFLLHVQQWEEAYPDRAGRWNARFPESKESEKKKYEQLKFFADSHKSNVDESEATTTTIKSSQRPECPRGEECNEETVTNDGRQEETVSESEEISGPEEDEPSEE